MCSLIRWLWLASFSWKFDGVIPNSIVDWEIVYRSTCCVPWNVERKAWPNEHSLASQCLYSVVRVQNMFQIKTRINSYKTRELRRNNQLFLDFFINLKREIFKVFTLHLRPEMPFTQFTPGRKIAKRDRNDLVRELISTSLIKVIPYWLLYHHVHNAPF